MKKLEVIISVVFVVICLGMHFTWKYYHSSGNVAVVTYNNKELKKIDISKDRELLLKVGNSIIKIVVNEKRICIAESNCPENICVKTGWINKMGQYIVCVPNGIIVSIENSNKKEYDTITY